MAYPPRKKLPKKIKFSRKYNEEFKDLAEFCFELLKSDRDINIGVAGFTGEGKSRFLAGFLKCYAQISGTTFSYSKQMTWQRKELKKLIDTLPEYSCIDADELFAMFYKRNWFTDEQKELLTILNTCRDRHLLIGGNCPLLWDLDGAFLSRLRFYVYIAYRGVAWVFQQENNPFSKDPWNVSANAKLFRMSHNPYSLPNFITEIQYSDFSDKDKEAYYKIRNSKRHLSVQDIKKDKATNYNKIMSQRDICIKWLHELLPKATNKSFSDRIGLSTEQIRKVRYNIIK